MASQKLQALQASKRRTHQVLWGYLHIMANYGQRLRANPELDTYVYQRYLQAKQNDALAWEKIRNYIKGI